MTRWLHLGRTSCITQSIYNLIWELNLIEIMLLKKQLRSRLGTVGNNTEAINQQRSIVIPDVSFKSCNATY